MILNDRQKNILTKAVFEYINEAAPVSSRCLEERYDLQVSPATIRNELFVLTEEGFLAQPYTSAGRIPTDKGYRFFVDRIAEEEPAADENFFTIDSPGKGTWSYLDRWQYAAKSVAKASSNLIILYMPARGSEGMLPRSFPAPIAAIASLGLLAIVFVFR